GPVQQPRPGHEPAGGLLPPVRCDQRPAVARPPLGAERPLGRGRAVAGRTLGNGAARIIGARSPVRTVERLSNNPGPPGVVSVVANPFVRTSGLFLVVKGEELPFDLGWPSEKVAAFQVALARASGEPCPFTARG